MAVPTTLDYASAPPPDPIPLPRRLAAEFVGTFALVFAGCGAIAAGGIMGSEVGPLGIALAFGLTITVFVVAVGDISGAHFNPAVTTAFAVARRMTAGDAAAYVAIQCIAAMVAALLLVALFPKLSTFGATVPGTMYMQTHLGGPTLGEQNAVVYSLYRSLGTPDRPLGVVRAVTYEIILTFFLVFVILCVAIGSKERGLMAGIAIGGTVAFCAMVGGPVSGASMNPARSLGPALVSGWDAMSHLWIYWTAPFLGSLLAVGAWTYIYRPTRAGDRAESATA